MSVKFVPLTLVEDPDERFYCIGCRQWTATLCVVNSDETWQGYACCDDEEHAAIAIKAHGEVMTRDPDDATPFWEDPISYFAEATRKDDHFK